MQKYLIIILKNKVMRLTRKKDLFLIVLLLLSTTGLFAADGTPVDSGATAWMLTSTALVLLMIPGLAMFYGGLGPFKKCAWDNYA